MSIRCVCVDDEPLAREGIALALEPYPDFVLTDMFADADSLLDNCPDNIDVLFVDIEMPRKSGFELLEQWSGPLPIVVFVTAYDQYAVKAFEQQALDYLLKPIDETRFKQVLLRIRQSLDNQHSVQTTDKLKQTIDDLRQKITMNQAAISVKTDDGYFRIKVGEILYLEGVGDHVCLHLSDKQVLTRDTLKNYATQLAEHGFHQVHKSFVVNIAAVVKVEKLRFGDHQLELHGGDKVRLSRRYKSVLSNIGVRS